MQFSLPRRAFPVITIFIQSSSTSTSVSQVQIQAHSPPLSDRACFFLSFFWGGRGAQGGKRNWGRLWQLLGGRVSRACLFLFVSLFFFLDCFSYLLATLIPNRWNTALQGLLQLYLSLIWDFFFLLWTLFCIFLKQSNVVCCFFFFLLWLWTCLISS